MLLYPLVKSELQRMEREGIITKAEGPTNWYVLYRDGGGTKTKPEGTHWFDSSQ